MHVIWGYTGNHTICLSQLLLSFCLFKIYTLRAMKIGMVPSKGMLGILWLHNVMHTLCGSLHAFVSVCVCVCVCVCVRVYLCVCMRACGNSYITLPDCLIFTCYAEADVPDRQHPVDHSH